MTHSLLLCCIKVLSFIILLSHIINNTFILIVRVQAKYIHQGSVWIICWTRVDVMENCVSQPGCHDLRLSDPDMGDWNYIKWPPPLSFVVSDVGVFKEKCGWVMFVVFDEWSQWCCWCVQREVWVMLVVFDEWMKCVSLMWFIQWI